MQHLAHFDRNFLARHAGILDQRKRDIIEHAHGIEQRTRLKKHPEFLAHLVEARDYSAG